MDMCAKGTDSWGNIYDNSLSTDCLIQRIDSLNNWLVNGSIVFAVVLLIAGIVTYFIVKEMKREIKVQRYRIADLENRVTNVYNPDSHYSQLQHLKEQLGEHSLDITEHEGRLDEHSEWIKDDGRQTFYILSTFAEILRLNASRQRVTLKDFAQMVMDRLANDKNPSGTSGKDSNTETTDGSTH